MKNKKLNVPANQISTEDHTTLTQILAELDQGEAVQQLLSKLNATEIATDVAPTMDYVRLNCTVKLLDLHTNRPMEFTLVVPNEANIKQRKISVLTPIGIALIGERKGAQIMWSIGGGKREVTILEVG